MKVNFAARHYLGADRLAQAEKLKDRLQKRDGKAMVLTYRFPYASFCAQQASLHYGVISGTDVDLYEQNKPTAPSNSSDPVKGFRRYNREFLKLRIDRRVARQQKIARPFRAMFSMGD